MTTPRRAHARRGGAAAYLLTLALTLTGCSGEHGSAGGDEGVRPANAKERVAALAAFNADPDTATIRDRVTLGPAEATFVGGVLWVKGTWKVTPGTGLDDVTAVLSGSEKSLDLVEVGTNAVGCGVDNLDVVDLLHLSCPREATPKPTTHGE